MAAKGSKLSRTIQYFIDGELEECRYVLSRATEIMVKRNGGKRAENPVVKTMKPRKAKSSVVETNLDPQVAEAAHHSHSA